MPDSSTAEIIQFPRRPVTLPATSLAPTPSDPTAAEARLARALAGLNDALTAQRAAVAAWKTSLDALSTSTGRLAASLRGYNDSLSRLDARVASLHTETKKLDAWADGVASEEG